MPLVRSTRIERLACQRLVRQTEREILRRIERGEKVHVIWDMDHVLVSGRSDDAFALLGFDVNKYFTYEERLLVEPLEPGPWTGLAQRLSRSSATQDIVTARSSFLAMRVMFFLVCQMINVRWQLFVGHQPKTESYRIILRSIEKDPTVHVYCIDDAAKHIDAFNVVATELGLTSRCHGIIAPQIRLHSEDELQREIKGVMRDDATDTYFVDVHPHRKRRYARQVVITPKPRDAVKAMMIGGGLDAHKRAVVAGLRPQLETFADQMLPGKPKTVDTLFFLYELVREPA